MTLLRLTGEHLLIVCIAVGIAIAAGIPLGTFAYRRRNAGAFALRVTDAIQTIPSLAMFGFLIPLPFIGGIGARPAIVALVLYSLLPIVRSTLVGLQRVDPHVREAAVGGGGLGTLIFRGVAMVDTRLILSGALPAALLALIADFVLTRVERHFARARGEA